MATFRIKNDGPAERRTFAIGRDSGTLYMMIDASRGVVLAGKGVFANREGEIVFAAHGKGVRYLPAGAIIEIEV